VRRARPPHECRGYAAAEITLGVDQRLPPKRDRPVVLDVRDADLDDAVVVRRQDAGGLEVDDSE
jgi:hypothetical protein